MITWPAVVDLRVSPPNGHFPRMRLCVGPFCVAVVFDVGFFCVDFFCVGFCCVDFFCVGFSCVGFLVSVFFGVGFFGVGFFGFFPVGFSVSVFSVSVIALPNGPPSWGTQWVSDLSRVMTLSASPPPTEPEDLDVPHCSLLTEKLVYLERSRPMRHVTPKRKFEYASDGALVPRENREIAVGGA